MVSGHAVIAKSAVPGRPLASRWQRAVLPAVAALFGVVLLTRAGPSQYAVVAPLLTLAAVVAVVIAAVRITHDRSTDLACWSAAAGSAAFLGLGRLSGPATGSDLSSAVVFPVAMALLAVALLTLPHRGVS